MTPDQIIEGLRPLSDPAKIASDALRELKSDQTQERLRRKRD